MRRNSGQIVMGLVLLFLGGFFLLNNLGFLRGEAFLVFLGLAFVGAYLLTGRQVGFLVPGAVLVSLGLFAGLEQSRFFWGQRAGGGWFFMFMALAFAAVFIIDSLGRASPTTWALFPAAGLGLFGLILLGIDVVPRSLWRTTATWWPIVLILVGLLFLLKPKR